MQDEKAKIDKIIQESNDFKLGDYLGRGFELFQKDIGGFVVFTLIFFILSMVIGVIPFVGSIANSFFIGPALTVGIYLVARRLDRGEPTEFGQYFKGFDFMGKLPLVALATAVITSLALVPFALVVWDPAWLEWYQEVVQNPGSPPPAIPVMPPLWSLLLLLPLFYIGIVYSFSYHFTIFHGLDFWSAMEASRRLLTKHFFMFFVFGLVLGLILVVSLCLFCIGILAGFPIVYCALYAAFADLTKLNAAPEATEGEGLERHLVD
jgi:uncharacterized membrane protein